MKLLCCEAVKGRQKRGGRHPRQCCGPRLAPKRQSRKPIFRLAHTFGCKTAAPPQPHRAGLLKVTFFPFRDPSGMLGFRTLA
jgi:hypothetical protein